MGSLDSLVSLTDELARADAQLEACFKRAERAVTDSYIAANVAKYLEEKGAAADLTKMPPIKPQTFYSLGKPVHNWVGLPREQWPRTSSASSSAGGGSTPGGHTAPATTFLQVFEWDSQEWDIMEPLPSLIRRIISAAEKTDQELRAAMQTYTEKKTALVAAERKIG